MDASPCELVCCLTRSTPLLYISVILGSNGWRIRSVLVEPCRRGVPIPRPRFLPHQPPTCPTGEITKRTHVGNDLDGQRIVRKLVYANTRSQRKSDWPARFDAAPFIGNWTLTFIPYFSLLVSCFRRMRPIRPSIRIPLCPGTEVLDEFWARIGSFAKSPCCRSQPGATRCLSESRTGSSLEAHQSHPILPLCWRHRLRSVATTSTKP